MTTDHYMSERAAFEAWAKDRHDLTRWHEPADDDSGYRDEETTAAWDAWREGRAALAVAPESTNTVSIIKQIAQQWDGCEYDVTSVGVVDIGDAIRRAGLALAAAPAQAPAEDISMPQYWSVQVDVDGENLLTIGHNWMDGRILEAGDERTIIGAAQHLLSFVGYGLPATSFDPDADDDDAAPQPAPEAQPLTDEQIDKIARDAIRGTLHLRDGRTSIRIARAIEQAHGIAAAKERP